MSQSRGLHLLIFAPSSPVSSILHLSYKLLLLQLLMDKDRLAETLCNILEEDIHESES